MTVQSPEPHPFVSHLERLQEDRAALAALRRGLGQPAGYAPEMFPYVVPFVPAEAGPWREAVYYLIASLFGFYPVSTNSGNMGEHFARLRNKRDSDDIAVERRFNVLLAAHPDDLGGHLRQAVSLLRANEVPVNWQQLFLDAQAWGHPDPDRRVWVRKRWASAFWGRGASPAEGTEPTESDG